MMRHKVSTDDGRSLKTFIIYAGIVFFVICISLSIKGFFIFQKSKFDGEHHLTLALAKDGKVAEIIAFNPSTSSFYLLRMKEGNMQIGALGKSLGIAPDATIEIKGDKLPFGDDVARTMVQATLQYHSIKTDLTIFDTIRLGLLAKGIPENNKVVREVSHVNENGDVDKIISSYFTDEAISAEDISVQIINASDMPGMGKRFERVLSNMGANVVRVTSSEKKEKKSKIQYYGEETYTLHKFSKTFGFPVSILDKQGIGNIVIIIGEDSVGSSKF